jgi:hypothetical protein
MNYQRIAFSESVKALQEKAGSRAGYARMENRSGAGGLTEYEADFISQRDSFYMATIGEQGFPYIQHRGGPKGFLKVLDKNRLGCIDFSGNKQYISVGNIAGNTKVALILMDYPAQARLKLFVEVELINLVDDPALFDSLKLDGYAHRPERMMVLHVKAYDWNYPQHITPRFTIAELEDVLAEQNRYVDKLEKEVKSLKAKLKR